MTLKSILLICLIIAYFAYTSYAQVKILKSIKLDSKRKLLNSVMIWIIPFIWYSLFKGLIISDNQILTKKKRDRLIRKDRKANKSGFHGSRGF